MQLYTIILDQKHIVSKFDCKGNKISETTTIVKQTIHDLPLSTAQMYMRTSEPGTCQMIKQDPLVRSGSRRHEVEFSDVKKGKSKRAEPTKTTAKARAKPAADPSKKVREAAQTGDLAAAISAGA